jgi:hypothetical protein
MEPLREAVVSVLPTYIARHVTGTVAEIDLFVKQGMIESCPPPSALTLMLTPSKGP